MPGWVVPPPREPTESAEDLRRERAEKVRSLENFCFRLYKRGAHVLEEPSPALEREIGGAIWSALRERDGQEPRVDLTDPEVTLAAEVLGPRTALCLEPRAWRAAGARPPSGR